MKGCAMFLGFSELKLDKKRLLKGAVAEFLGCFFLLFFGCGACLDRWDEQMAPSVVQIALSFGLIIAAMVQVTGEVSGGHLNPAVTFALLLIGQVSMIRAVLFMVIQILGAVAGTATLRALAPTNMTPKEFDLRVISDMHPDLSQVQAFIIEALLTFVLMMVILAVTDRNRNGGHAQTVGPIVIGLTVAAGHLTGVTLSGSSMNPARSLGPAVVMNNYRYIWIYCAGPTLGSSVAALVYRFVLRTRLEDVSISEEESADF